MQAKEELMLMRHERISSPKSAKTSLAAQALMRRVENERDDAMSDLQRITTERDSLRERLKVPSIMAYSVVSWFQHFQRFLYLSSFCFVGDCTVFQCSNALLYSCCCYSTCISRR